MIIKRLACAVGCFLMLLCGCGSIKQRTNHARWFEHEARLYDIPILLNAKPLNSKLDSHKDYTSSFSYTVSMESDQAVLWYEQEMERLGWQLCASFYDEETLLIFEKPTKICALSFRTCKDHLIVIVFYKMK